MKILQILPELNFGGVEMGTIDLAQALIKRGHQAYVISAGGALVGQLIKRGVTHYELPVHTKSLRTLLLIHNVRAIIEREGIDVVHARSRIPAWIAFFATRKTKAKFVTTCHGYYAKHGVSRVMGWGERVIVISRAIGRHMIDDFGVLPERVTLIHRGINLKKYTCDPARYAPERLKRKEKFVIATIGRLSPIKGHEYFIKAVHLVSHQFPQVEAWIVGGGKAKYLTTLKVLVDKLGISNTVKFLGEEKNVPALLPKVDLLVLPTTYPEGFGRVIIEAGASGVAVVATKVGGVPDIITDGKHGVLVPPQDEIRLSDAIMRLMRDPGLTQTLATNLRKKVEESFTVKEMVDKTIRVYEEVKQARRILIMKLGALGDIILAIPSMRMLRKKFPHAYIAVLVDAQFTACLEYCPYINDIIPFKRREKKDMFKHIYGIVKKIRQQSFDISIDFQNNTKTHAMAHLAGVPARYGYRRGMLGGLLTHGVGSFRDPLPPVQHQFRVLNLLGITEYDERLELWPQEDDYQYVELCLSKAWSGEVKKTVGFVLGASERWLSKKWPLKNYMVLGKRLERELGCGLVLIGDKNSTADRDLFRTACSGPLLDMVGRTTILQLAALIDKIDCIVCGDTAPLHVASAMNTKIVALFGPTDPRRHMPPGGRHKVIKRTLGCSPCYAERCVLDHKCMEDITVDEVYEAVKRQLKA